MTSFKPAMKSIIAMCLASILYCSMEVLGQESVEQAAHTEDIYVASLQTTAKLVPASTYQESRAEPRELREARKVGLLRGMWKKPRVSPLYLVNGTICRFVNSSPICTTLATTGLGLNGNTNGSNNVNPNNFNPNNLSQFGNNQQFLPNNNNNVNNQQFSNRNNNNNNNNQLYTPGNLPVNNNQFPRQQQQPQFVSAALNEEESQEVPVQTEASDSLGDNPATETQQVKATSPPKPVQSQQAPSTNKPAVVNRRPLLPLRLPLRQFSIG